MDTDDTDLQSELVDLTGFDFACLSALPRSVLVSALERVHRGHDPVNPWAMFESALVDDGEGAAVSGRPGSAAR